MISLCAGYAKLSLDCTCCAKYRHSNLHVNWSQASWLMVLEILCAQQLHSHSGLIPHCVLFLSSLETHLLIKTNSSVKKI